MSNLLDRLATKFTVGDDCWEWTAARIPDGYGFVRTDNGRNTVAHRVIYELLVGPIPDGLELDHLCRNRGCVRPAHMEPVTHLENVRRGHAKFNGAHERAKTECPQGHPYDEANTYMHRGNRHCKACTYARNKARRERGLR